MGAVHEVWVNRKNLRETRLVDREARALEPGEIRVAIDRFGLTANNVSYAVSGDMIGYWKYYPAEGDWGKVPVWGMANVVESHAHDIAVGERLYGFFPMASETILTVGTVHADAFMDATPHRQELPALYNQYRRTSAEPAFLAGLEVERCLLFPLFMTSFVLFDYLEDNDYFGAEQVLIGSVSSKTGFGLAKLLKQAGSLKVIGLTSPGNLSFVHALGCCDQVVAYGHETEIEADRPTAYVDMSGNGTLTETLHHHLGERMVESCMVGATHWESRGRGSDLPGARPTFFFAPAQIAKRDKEWGRGVLFDKASVAGAAMAKEIADKVSVEWVRGGEDTARIWTEMLDNQVSPDRGIMAAVSV
jgi:NADPH:quinone reductase-like Zn-dependent oxidoreductase